VKSDVTTAVVSVLCAVVFLVSGVIIGLTMGITRDFSLEGGAWAVYPLMLLIIVGGWFLVGPYAGTSAGFMLVGAMSYMIGYFQRMFWGASWDLG